ncbi:MAG TPA: DUF790 family protein, partial [Ktedonobacterales bacterium]
FDSSLERMLHDEFSALERVGEAHGWHLEREPEPLIVGGVIVVPDFAVTRGFKRVYLEIAGYWRPDYRERKVRKLNALRDSVSQVVAAPEPARADFAALDPTIPVLWYGNRVSAAALLGLLDRAYDDFAQRVAALDPAQIRAEVQKRGCVPPTEAFVLLHCYTRSELAAALDHINGAPSEDSSPSIHWIEGLGLCSTPWLATLLERIRVHVESTADGRLSLTALTEHIAGEVSEARDVSSSSIELLAAQAGLTVSRASIFDVEVLSPHAAPASEPASASPAITRSGQLPQPRGSVRRKQQQKSPQPAYTATSIFSFIPSERPGNDETEPDTPSRAREQMPGDTAEGGAQ